MGSYGRLDYSRIRPIAICLRKCLTKHFLIGKQLGRTDHNGNPYYLQDN